MIFASCFLYIDGRFSKNNFAKICYILLFPFLFQVYLELGLKETEEKDLYGETQMTIYVDFMISVCLPNI